MVVNKRPIHRSLFIGCAVFIAFMCLLFSVQAYYSYSKTLYSRYNEKLSGLLNHITKNIDLDDLYQSVITGEKSEKYPQVQQILNSIVDEFNLFYLYSGFVRGKQMVNICSATSEEERSRGEQDMELLETSDAYPEEELKKFSTATSLDEISFFEETSEWGAAYTACKPLVNSTGVHYGVLCADISTEALHKALHKSVFYSILLTLGTGILFATILIFWLRRNVTGPIVALEKSVQKFAEQSHGNKDLAALVFDSPDINTHNEVESLSNSITKMTEDMKVYVQDIVKAEQTAKSAQEKANNMTMLAYKDALTHVGSKIAYDNAARALAKDVADNSISEFGIVMIDLNNLKVINDSYGHANGNTYISGACHIICTIFRHSPVFRIGGDEFIVILKGDDYAVRQKLVDQARQKFFETENDNSKEPWERYSVAIGIAEYKAGDTIENVFTRADEDMYQNKQNMKKARV